MQFMGGILLIWQHTTMQVHVYGAWIRIYYILCSNTLIGLYDLPVRDEPLGVPTFARLIIELK